MVLSFLEGSGLSGRAAVGEAQTLGATQGPVPVPTGAGTLIALAWGSQGWDRVWHEDGTEGGLGVPLAGECGKRWASLSPAYLAQGQPQHMLTVATTFLGEPEEKLRRQARLSTPLTGEETEAQRGNVTYMSHSQGGQQSEVQMFCFLPS